MYYISDYYPENMHIEPLQTTHRDKFGIRIYQWHFRLITDYGFQSQQVAHA